MGVRTRRLSPTVLVSLALLFGLFGLAAPAASLTSSVAGAGSPAASVAHAVADPMDHAVGRGSDAGAQSRVIWQRQTGGPAPLTVAVFFAALVGCLLATRRAVRSSAAASPAAGGRFARDSRAPPGRRPLPA